jgi:pimeloyl-ACP methyl ester carboxylesterase
MHAADTSLRKPRRTALILVGVRARRETTLAVAALAAISAHVLDDNLFQPQPGTAPADHVVSTGVPLAALLAFAAAYPLLRSGLRAAIAIPVGLLGIVAGVAEAGYYSLHGGPSGDDYTGLLAIPAGLLLVGLGATTLWTTRRRDDGLLRRYLRRLMKSASALVGAYIVLFPFALSYVFTHSARAVVPAAKLGAAHENVSFTTSDGLTLKGWYVPSKNHAAVIAAPGRAGARKQARMLVRHGYGVLLFDRRGEGESDGDPNAFGWAADKDMNAAVAFLQQRPDVDRNRIGGIGLSVGAETLLQTAAESRGLNAVVADGAGSRSLREDLARAGEIPTSLVITAGTMLFSNHAAPPNLKNLVGRIAPRPVFFIYGQHDQDNVRELTPGYYATAGEPKAIWEVAGAAHTGGIDAQPREYERRVIAFFDQALLGADASTIQWAPCKRVAPTAVTGTRCGSIGVPLDRSSVRRGTTKIAFALVPRRDSSRPSLGTVVLSGGPILAAAGEFTRGVTPLRNRRDVLFVDQRGTGQSDVLVCPALRGVVARLLSEQQMIARIGVCGHQLGARAGLYGTAAAADDLEAVRAALGLQRLDLWGASYGTYLMTVYAARHPAHVQSLVLHGAYPIDFDPWALDRLAAARRSIHLVCARTGGCDGGIVLRGLGELAKRLRAHPVSFTVPTRLGPTTVRLDEAALAELTFGAGDIAGFGRLPAATAGALAGDLAPLRRLVELKLQPLDQTFAQAFAQQCHEYPRVYGYADSQADRRATYLDARAALSRRALAPFSAEAWTATQLEAAGTCLQWPNDRTGGRPFPASTSLPGVPVLVLSGDLDTNTSAAAGREAARQFPNARFLEIPNVGHTPESSPCAVALALRFIATHTVNERACVRTGAPPPIAARAPRSAAGLALPAGGGTAAERRAIAVILATASDMQEQAEAVGRWGAANGLRGGRYLPAPHGTIRLNGVRVVHDATVSGSLTQTEAGGIEGTVRIGGANVAHGLIQVSLTANGRGRVTGRLNGAAIDLRFRF